MSTVENTLKVALLQTHIHWCNVEQNLIHLDELLSQCGQVDLVLLPETFATGFAIDLDVAQTAENGDTLNWMKAMAKRLNAVVAGSVLVQFEEKKRNRFYWVWPDGQVKFYDKRHLFRLGNEGDHVGAGQVREIYTINGFRILPQVCYDLRFPVFQRNRNDYDVMVNVANWPAARRYAWDLLLIARAIENQSYVLGCTRVGEDGKGVAHSGGTAAYDFLGQPLMQASDDMESLNIVTLSLDELNKYRAHFPAYLDADEFKLV
jgi:predicted amidohydrolase